jgi:serine protease Do
VILAVNGSELAEAGEFAFLVEAAMAEEKALLTIRRGAETLDLEMPFAAPEDLELTLGIKVRELDLSAMPEKITSYRMSALGVMFGDTGLVDAVTENSPALFAGLVRGDRIVSVNGVAVDVAALETLEITGAALLLVEAPDGSTRHIVMDPWGGADGVRPVGGANVLDPDVVVF